MASAAKKPKLHSKSFPVTCFDESAGFRAHSSSGGETHARRLSKPTPNHLATEKGAFTEAGVIRLEIFPEMAQSGNCALCPLDVKRAKSSAQSPKLRPMSDVQPPRNPKPG